MGKHVLQIVLIAVFAVVIAAPVLAGGVPLPMPPKGKGDKCVADTDYMRRYHMTMLKHQRDGTMHEGIRTKQYSLKECVTCHAVPGTSGRAVTYKDEKHFCRTCHDYAAVTIDCFGCHASRPGEKAAASQKGGKHPVFAGALEKVIK